jgi:hypothetical protein
MAGGHGTPHGRAQRRGGAAFSPAVQQAAPQGLRPAARIAIAAVMAGIAAGWAPAPREPSSPPARPSVAVA